LVCSVGALRAATVAAETLALIACTPATSTHADRAAGRPRASREGDAGPPAA